MDTVAETVQQLLSSQGVTALQYGSGQGDPRLREQILEVMALEGIRAHADDIVVTTGSQQALDLVTRVFIDPGDVILAEAPSYVGALGVFAAYQAQVAHVTSDDEGLVPAALEERDRRPGGRRPADQVPLHGAHVLQPRRYDADGAAAPADPRHLRPARHPRARGQPLRPARLRPRALPGDALPVRGGRGLPRLVLQDVRPRAAGRLGRRAARRAREAGPGLGVGHPVPECVLADDRLQLPGRLRLAGADQGLPRALPRAA